MQRLKQPANTNKQHFVKRYFDAYQDGVLSERETETYRQHLSTCDECQTWVDSQLRITQQLRNEALSSKRLSPATTTRIQQHISSRMRRALIMNSIKTFVGSAVTIAVLAVIIGFFVWQTRNINTVEIVEEVTPDVEAVTQATSESAIAAVATKEQLIEAVLAGDAATVEQILKAGISPDVTDSSGDSILELAVFDAISSGNTDIVELLVNHGADVNVLTKVRDELLPQAAQAGQPEVTQLLLDAGADVNSTMTFVANSGAYFNEAPAILHAVDDNHIEVVELLIAYGADVNLTEKAFNGHALFSAAFYNYTELVTLLLDNGADPHIHTNWDEGITPLHGAADNGSAQAIQALLDGGANPDIQTNTGLTPIMHMISYGWAGNKHEIAKTFLEGGADPNVQDNEGNTALHIAIREDVPIVIPLLIEHGIALDIENNDGDTALHIAVKRKRAEVVSILLENGASFDLENNDGETAIDVATDEEIIEMLREAGAEE